MFELLLAFLLLMQNTEVIDYHKKIAIFKSETKIVRVDNSKEKVIATYYVSASHYGQDFVSETGHAYNGDEFDNDGLFGACINNQENMDIFLNKKVRITNLYNKNSVIIYINDTGGFNNINDTFYFPWLNGYRELPRRIDCTEGTFRKLIEGDKKVFDLIPVRIDILAE